jgi:hypothetical protein
VGVTSVDSVLEESQEREDTPSLALMQPLYQPQVPTGEGRVSAIAPILPSATTASAPPTFLGPDPEAEAWAFVRDTTNPQDFTDFLAAYPEGRFSVAARLRLGQLQRQYQTVPPPPAPKETIPSLITETQKRTPTLEALGASPLWIRHVQMRLGEIGFTPGPIDGIFGSRTAVALRQYQKQYGLPVTGRLDAATLEALHIPILGAPIGRHEVR